MADDVTVSFVASIEKLIKGIGDATKAVEGFAEPLQKIVGFAAEAGEAIAAAFAIEKIASFFEHMAELGTQTQRTAALLGVSTDAVSGLDIAARASGGSLEGMTTSLEKFGLNLARGAAGSEQQEAGLRALGLSAKDFIGVPLPEVLAKLADHFAVLKDGIDKDAIAMAVLGRGGAQMIPIFNQGGAAFKEFAEIAERAGSNMSSETAAGFEKTHLGLIELDKSFQGLGITVASAFKPAFDGIVKTISDMVEAFNVSLKQGGLVRVMLAELTSSAKVLATAFAAIVAVVEAAWAVMSKVFDDMGTTVRGLGAMIYAAFRGDLPGVEAAWKDMLKGMEKNTLDFGKEVLAIWGRTEEQLGIIWAAGADKHGRIEQTKVPKLEMVNRQQLAAMMAYYQNAIKLSEDYYREQVERINTSAKLYGITETQKTQQLLAALALRENSERNQLEMELKIRGLTVDQRQKIEDQITQIAAKARLDRQKILDQELFYNKTQWEGTINSIKGAWDSQLRGLLAGTTSWSQAMKNITADLVIKMIEEFETLAIVKPLLNSLATITPPAEVFSSILKVIMASVGQVFAGASAFFAPELGPAAPAAAAGVAGAVEAGAMSFGKFETGAWEIPGVIGALLHPKEMVLPAGPASAVRDFFGGGAGGAGGGENHFNFNISAWDGASVNSWLNRGGNRQLARSIRDHLNLNPSMRPT